MNVKVTMSDILAKASGLQVPFETSADTPLECLQMLAARNPVLNEWLFKANGELADEIWLIVNTERLGTDEFTLPLQHGDEVCILVAVTGG